MAKNHPIIRQGTRNRPITYVTPAEAVILGIVAQDIKKGVDAFFWRRKLELDKKLQPEYDEKGNRTSAGLTLHCIDIIKRWEDTYCSKRREDPDYIKFNISTFDNQFSIRNLSPKIRSEYLKLYGGI